MVPETFKRVVYGWRTWLIAVGALFAGVGWILRNENPLWEITQPTEIWFVLWVPAGLVAAWFGITGKPPTGAFYMVIPGLLGAGAAARALLLFLAGSTIAPIPWLLVAALVGPAWQKAVPTSQVYPPMRPRAVKEGR